MNRPVPIRCCGLGGGVAPDPQPYVRGRRVGPVAAYRERGGGFCAVGADRSSSRFAKRPKDAIAPFFTWGFCAVGSKRSASRLANGGTQRPKGAIAPFFTWGVLHRRNGSLRFEIRKRSNSTAGFGPVHTIAIGFVPAHTSPHTSPRCHVSPTSSRRSVL